MCRYLDGQAAVCGRPQRICAWLHHELTGKWPNEGKGKRGAGEVTVSVVAS